MKVRILREPGSCHRAFVVSPNAEQDDEVVWVRVACGTTCDTLCERPSEYAQAQLESLLRRGYQITDGGPVPLVTTIADPLRVSHWKRNGSRAEISWDLPGGRYSGGNAMTNRYLRLGCDMPGPDGESPETIWWTWGEYYGGHLRLTIADSERMEAQLNNALQALAEQITPTPSGYIPWIPVLDHLRPFPASEVRAIFGQFSAACYRSLREHQQRHAQRLGWVGTLREPPAGRAPLALPPQRPRKIDLE